MAKAMGRRHVGFPGGVYLYNNPASDQAYNISNMILDPDGRPYKRQGFNFKTALPPLGAGILSLFRWDRPGAAPQLLAHANDGKLYYTTDLLNWTESGAGAVFSTTNPMCFEPFIDGSTPTALNVVYLADGVGALRKWTGSAVANVAGSPPNAIRWLKVWDGTMFAIATHPDRLYFSKAAQADSAGAWDVLAYVDLGHGDGDHLTALFTASQELVVSKQNRTWVFTDSNTKANRVADYEKGAESHFAVVKFDADIYYLTRFGIARYVSGTTAELVSNNIQPIFTPLFLNMARMSQAWGYRLFHRVGFSLVRDGQTKPDYVIEYYPHYPRQPWTFHRLPGSTFVTWRDTDERLFFSDGSRALLEGFVNGQTTDEGVSGWDPYFRGVIQTLWDDLDDPINRKYLRAIRLFGEGKIYIQVGRDRRSALGQQMVADLIPEDPKWNEGAADKWDIDDQWGTFGSIGTDIVYPDYYGRQFSILMYDLPIPGEPQIPAQRRSIADVPISYPHGWSLLEMTLEAIQMGELG